MSTQPTAAARILAQQRQMAGKDVTCEKCGSTYFYEVQTSLYLAGGSGSVEILQDTNAQVFPLLKCAGCNFPVLPKPAVGRRHGGVFESAHSEFRVSIKKGQDYLNTLNPEDIESNVVQAVNNTSLPLQNRVEDLHERLSALEEQLGEPAHASADATATESKPNDATKS